MGLFLQVLSQPWSCHQFMSFVLYPTTLPNSLMRSNIALIESFDSHIYRFMSSVNRDNFNLMFPIWIPLIAFSYLRVRMRTSSTMLNSSNKSAHSWLVPYFSGKACSLSLFILMVTWVFHILFWLHSRKFLQWLYCFRF